MLAPEYELPSSIGQAFRGYRRWRSAQTIVTAARIDSLARQAAPQARTQTRVQPRDALIHPAELVFYAVERKSHHNIAEQD
jgi:uncharacterized damage-inducible protein DinB